MLGLFQIRTLEGNLSKLVSKIANIAFLSNRKLVVFDTGTVKLGV